MAYSLVVREATPQYPEGTILTDIDDINRFRLSEYAYQAVQVSDAVIPPPEPPPPPADLTAIQQAVHVVAQKNTAQDAALAEAQAANAVQTAQIQAQSTTIQQQNATIGDLNTMVGIQNSLINQQRTALDALAERVAAIESAPPPPPPVNTDDDKPLAENDDVVLANNAGSVLAGDVRGDGLRP